MIATVIVVEAALQTRGFYYGVSAIFVVGTGHWITGTIAILGAYALGERSGVRLVYLFEGADATRTILVN